MVDSCISETFFDVLLLRSYPTQSLVSENAPSGEKNGFEIVEKQTKENMCSCRIIIVLPTFLLCVFLLALLGKATPYAPQYF